MLSLIPKSTTSAIAMDIATQIGGNSAIAIVFVIATGIFGNILGPSVLELFGIKKQSSKRHFHRNRIPCSWNSKGYGNRRSRRGYEFISHRNSRFNNSIFSSYNIKNIKLIISLNERMIL